LKQNAQRRGKESVCGRSPRAVQKLQKTAKDPLVDKFIRVINQGHDGAQVQSALIEALTLLIVQNTDKPYEAIEDVISELRDSFDGEVALALELGSLLR
jgi:hypothetical protein